MRPRQASRWIAALLVLALALAVPAAATLPHPRSKTIVPGRSIGGVQIGQTSAGARAAWGPGETCINKVSGECSWITIQDGVASFTLRAGRVVDVAISAGSSGAGYAFGGPLRSLRTRRGIGIGSRVADVRLAYPSVRRTERELLLVADHRVTSFTIADGRVAGVTVRRAKRPG